MRLVLLFIFSTLIVFITGCNQSPPITETVVTPHSPVAISTPTITPIISLQISLQSESTIEASTENPATSQPAVASVTPSPTLPPPTSVSQAILTAHPEPTLSPEAWKMLPVVPEISDSVLQIYQRGLELGNNPRAYSKVGDCGSTPAWFLGDFDRGPRYYRLGNYQYLEAVIQEFKGSHARTSLAGRAGFNAASLLVPLWADPKQCQPTEHPLECEYRHHRPVIAFIMLGTNDIWHPQEFEPDMRKIIEYSIDNGVIPILSTKADNQEGDASINATIANLAVEYDIPLWNYWRAIQQLPDHGLQEDGIHLTWGPNQFDKPENMQKAWPVRNLTALQVLNAIWEKLAIHTQAP